jgi:hypothetical protein
MHLAQVWDNNPSLGQQTKLCSMLQYGHGKLKIPTPCFTVLRFITGKRVWLNHT